MTDHHLPVQYQAHATQKSSARLPAQTTASPVHNAGQLRFTAATATREELWSRLSPAVRSRVDQRVGRQLDWWADERDGRISAVVFGTRALIAVEPTINKMGQPATEIKAIDLDETTLRSARVNGVGVGAVGSEVRPGTTVSSTSLDGQAGDGPAEQDGSQSHRLSKSMSGFLGQLPPRAQALLQDPFLHSPRQLLCDHYYYRWGDSQSINGATLHAWCYLTDQRTVTFCAGIGRNYRHTAGPSTWELICWRIEVLPRSQH